MQSYDFFAEQRIKYFDKILSGKLSEYTNTNQRMNMPVIQRLI